MTTEEMQERLEIYVDELVSLGHWANYPGLEGYVGFECRDFYRAQVMEFYQ